MITGGSISRLVRLEIVAGERRVVQSMYVSDNQIKRFVTMGSIVNKLPKLGREKEDVIRLVTVKVTKKEYFQDRFVPWGNLHLD
jgi:hypothetical protein